MYSVTFLDNEDMMKILDYRDFVSDIEKARQYTKEFVRKYKVGRIKGCPDQLKIKLSKSELSSFLAIEKRFPTLYQYDEFLLLIRGDDLILRIEY